MKSFKKTWLALVVLITVIGLAGCGQAAVQKEQVQVEASQSVELTISAAASLKDAMEKIKELYAKEKSNVNIVYNFGSSGSLQKQIEQGAPVDVFLSAAKKQMNELNEKGLILNETQQELLSNTMVLVGTQESTVTGFEDLTTDKVKKIGVGEPNSVPAGKYANEIFTHLKITDKIADKTVQAKDVREVLTWVETGNADVGMVYQTDANGSKAVKIIAKAPEGSHTPIVYPIAVLKESKQVEEAKAFIEFLKTEPVQKVFEEFGFTTLKK